MLGREQQAASGGTAGCKWRKSRLQVEKKQAALSVGARWKMISMTMKGIIMAIIQKLKK
jgi:hypothetical protein